MHGRPIPKVKLAMPNSDLDDDEGLGWVGEAESGSQPSHATASTAATFIRAEVVIPEGLEPGDAFEVVLEGIPFEVTVPKDKRANDVLELEVPAEEFESRGTSDTPEPHLQPEDQRRHVSFTDAEPAVVLFRPEVGGLHGPGQLTSDELRRCEKCEKVELVVPAGCRPGDVLNVNAGSSEMEITVPENCRPGDILEVREQKFRHAFFFAVGL